MTKRVSTELHPYPNLKDDILRKAINQRAMEDAAQINALADIEDIVNELPVFKETVHLAIALHQIKVILDNLATERIRIHNYE